MRQSALMVGDIRESGTTDTEILLPEELARIVDIGYPTVRSPGPKVEVRWNPRLRSTVARTLFTKPMIIEISPRYHFAHPVELSETLAHEFAHVLHPNAGHGEPWRTELRAALQRLGLPERNNLAWAAHIAPGSYRYEWRCSSCGTIVAVRSRRRNDEISSYSTCCRRPIHIIDNTTGDEAAPRPWRVGCRTCSALYVAYDEATGARRFVHRHRCRCGGRLHTWEHQP